MKQLLFPAIGALAVCLFSCTKLPDASPESSPVEMRASLTGTASTGFIVDTDSVQADLTGVGVGLAVNHYTEAISSSPSFTFQDAVTQMKLKSLRWPEGEWAETYLWSQPPYTAPNPTASMWGPIWPISSPLYFNQTTHQPTNHLNFDEFMNLCIQTGTEPFVVIPIDAVKKPDLATWYASDTQIIENAVQMVRYAKLKGYPLKYYEIGNENDLTVKGGSDTVKWSPMQYTNFVIKLSRLMKAEDPTIKIGVNGTVSLTWWKTLLQNASADIDYMITHQYIPKGSLSGGTGNWYTNYRNRMNSGVSLLENVNRALKALKDYGSAADQERLKLAITETSSYCPGSNADSTYPDLNCFGSALIAYEMLRDMLKTNKIIALDFWASHYGTAYTVRNALSPYNGYLPTGNVVRLMAESILPRMIKVKPAPSYLPDQNVDVSAYYDPSQNKLNIIMINRDGTSKPVSASLPSAFATKTCLKAIRFLGTSPTDTAPTYLAIGNVTTNASAVLSVTIPAYSITHYAFKL